MEEKKIAIIDGIRTAMCKAGSTMKTMSAADLGTAAVKELMARTSIPPEEVDELIFGNVSQPADSANIARVVALRANLPISMPAYTVHRNCGSGAEALSTAAYKIIAGDGQAFIVGGTESMSNIPFMFNDRMKAWFEKLSRCKGLGQKLGQLASFRPSMLKPVIGVMQGLTDPVSGMIMGNTAEVLAREFQISRQEQDEFALLSHQRAIAAREFLSGEILPVPVPPDMKICDQDNGPREDQSMAALQKLRPYFDRVNGTVTVGNACPLTDGGCALLVMDADKAKELGLKPIGYLRAHAYAGLEPERMGLGPVYATAKMLDQSGIQMSDFDAIELNEAFAAQVIANERAFASDDFAKKYLNRDSAVGEIDRNILNMHGGAIALGHPVGMTGARLVLTVLRTLIEKDKSLGLATMCIGGGQGGALAIERA